MPNRTIDKLMADRVDRLRRQANMTQQRYAAEVCGRGIALLARHRFDEIGWKDSHEFVRCVEQCEGLQCLHGLYLWTFR